MIKKQRQNGSHSYRVVKVSKVPLTISCYSLLGFPLFLGIAGQGYSLYLCSRF
jgi:hypothetical protein